MVAKVLDSVQRLPDGKELVRWHLVDDNYQVIKPVEQFLRFKQSCGSAIGTIKIYAEKLKAFWKYLDIKVLDWQDFDLEEMAEFNHWYLTGGLLLDENFVSSNSENILVPRNESTVNLALTAVVQFYDFHVRRKTFDDKNLCVYRKPRRENQSGMFAGYRKESPVKVKLVKNKEREKFPGCLTPDQVCTLIDTCNQYRDKLMLWLLADTGMRKGELLGLHWSDIDWNARTLKIVRRDNINHAYAKGRERELSLAGLMTNREFCKILSKYSDIDYPHDVVKNLGHDMVFVVLHKGSPSYGKPLEPQNLNKLLKRLHQKTDIDITRIYPHLFRHTFATHNIRKGREKGQDQEKTAKSVQRQLGHKSIATTLDIYEHSFDEAEMLNEMERVTEGK
ncbi:MAG: tyrosine-type recombinase/integrase [Nostoc sp.]|uniref:tyrosine-type recombinase/integrase n=1 Tax=Nostoc sp. TaxID=1180 RepID=UPI002FF3113E